MTDSPYPVSILFHSSPKPVISTPGIFTIETLVHIVKSENETTSNQHRQRIILCVNVWQGIRMEMNQIDKSLSDYNCDPSD